jgi:hypothetical protein
LYLFIEVFRQITGEDLLQQGTGYITDANGNTYYSFPTGIIAGFALDA